MNPIPLFKSDPRGVQISPGQHQEPRHEGPGIGQYRPLQGSIPQPHSVVLPNQDVHPASSRATVAPLPAAPADTISASYSPKRKQDESASPPAQNQRAKRTRYISLACNECKRRKIKCNGLNPCQRCGHLKLQCLYTPNCCNNFKDSEEFKELQTTISALKQQISSLCTDLHGVQDYLGPGLLTFLNTQTGTVPTILPLPNSLSSQSSSLPRPTTEQKSRFRGPTSSAFSLGVAKSSLKQLDIQPANDLTDDGLGKEETPGTTPPPSSFRPPVPYSHLSGGAISIIKDPLWYLSLEDAIRLVRFWEEEIWVMFPLADAEKMIAHVRELYRLFELSERKGVDEHPQLVQALIHDQTKLLKVILATALTLEGHGKTELGILFSQHVERSVQEAVTSVSDLQVIRLLSSAALYYFHLHQDDESLAWRLTGLAARLCFELGLHKGETYHHSMSSHTERATSNKLMWSVYILDRRWTFGTGLPFAIQDSDMDPNLLQPDKPPYLCAMVDYSKIGSKVWQWVSNWDSSRSGFNQSEMDKLDWEIRQWYQRLPECLKNTSSQSWELKESKSRSNKRLRVLVRLRLNQMRILIYRPILHTPANIRENLSRAETVVEVAKSSIREITMLINNADIYRTQQVLFNYFLLSAVAVLVLSVCHAPGHFTSIVKEEFHMAVEFVRGFSADSVVARKLWKTLRSLKEVGRRLGVNFNSTRNQYVPPASGQSSAPGRSRTTVWNTLSRQPKLSTSRASPTSGLSTTPSGPHTLAVSVIEPPTVEPATGVPTEMVARTGQTVGSPSVSYGDPKMATSGDETSSANAVEMNLIDGLSNNIPNGMADDLAGLFQAAGGFAGLFENDENGYMSFPSTTAPSLTVGLGDSAGLAFFGQDNELSDVLKNLF